MKSKNKEVKVDKRSFFSRIFHKKQDPKKVEMDKCIKQETEIIKIIDELLKKESQIKLKDSEVRKKIDELTKKAEDIEEKERALKGGAISDDEVKLVLNVMDELLEKLPDEIVEKFSKSEHFKLYKRVLSRYEIK